ncbi:MAG: aldo/keto reductase [Microscillaceae bacterium]|nr:aldo/keto reductase [Microscillaceae bacterium]
METRIKLSEERKSPTLSRIVAGVMLWGEWGKKLNPQGINRLIQACIDLGITSFDHADIYGHYTTEADFGKALALSPGLLKKMELITKCGIKLVTPNRPEHQIKSYDTSRKHIIQSVENSLKNLQTDTLDLLLIHRPDPLLDPMEVADTFALLRSEGKVKYFGVSNFSPTQLDVLDAYMVFEDEIVTNQVEASLLHLNPFWDGTLDQCLTMGFSPMIWSPLGGGKLFETPSEDIQVQRIQEVSIDLMKKYEVSLDQLALAWLLQHPSQMIPVIGSASLERIRASWQALSVEMEREDWFKLWQASTGEEVP